MSELTTAITLGHMDDELDAIQQAITYRMKERKRSAAVALAADLQKGDRIQIKADAPLKPRYLLGIPMIVEQVNQTRAIVRVERPELLPSTRFAGGITCPLGYAEKLPAAA